MGENTTHFLKLENIPNSTHQPVCLPTDSQESHFPPGRPIVAAMESVTTGFSQYIDLYLQPIVKQLPSYIRDGSHLLELLASYKWEPSYLWLSLDVTSLYTSIPHSFGLLALEFFLAQDPFINPRQAAFILEATNFCLTHNYFDFNGDFYLQTKGTAMGANFAPSYANLAMGYWEKNFIIQNNPHCANIVFFGRYIDDIIIIWDGPVDLVSLFVQHCNSNPYGLSFTHVVDPTNLAFLDLDLGHLDNMIIAKKHIKPTAGNSYLHYRSCHYPKWTQNIPKGQFCRLRQNCTLDSDYDTMSIQLKKKFADKDYPKDLVDQACNYYAKGKPAKKDKEITDHSTRFITTFNFQYKKMENILKKHWSILLQDPLLKTSLPLIPRITYRKAPSLKNRIAPSKLPIDKPISNPTTLIPLVGMYQCKKARCKTCMFVEHGKKSFLSKGRIYTLEQFYNCSSNFVVYGLTCPCGLIYVGRTICPLRQRFGQHRRLIEGGKDKHSVPRHFAECHNKSTTGLSVWVIEQIPKHMSEAERFKKLCARETFWIYCLDVLSPGGLNEGIEISTVL